MGSFALHGETGIEKEYLKRTRNSKKLSALWKNPGTGTKTSMNLPPSDILPSPAGAGSPR